MERGAGGAWSGERVMQADKCGATAAVGVNGRQCGSAMDSNPYILAELIANRHIPFSTLHPPRSTPHAPRHSILAEKGGIEPFKIPKIWHRICYFLTWEMNTVSLGEIMYGQPFLSS